MIKASWGKCPRGLAKHLSYIAADGSYRYKRKNENVSVDPRIQTTSSRSSFLSDYMDTLAPDPSKGQRRGKRVSLQLIVSWINHACESQGEWLDDFIADGFGKGVVWTWARHEKPNRHGAMGSHFHLVICPRRKDGSMIDLKKADIRKLQSLYLTLSKKHQLRTGWDASSLKPRGPQKPLRNRDNRPKRTRSRRNKTAARTPTRRSP